MVCNVRNNSKAGLRNIAHFVNNKSHTNIVLMGVPHRFDQPDTSCNDCISVGNYVKQDCTSNDFVNNLSNRMCD